MIMITEERRAVIAGPPLFQIGEAPSASKTILCSRSTDGWLRFVQDDMVQRFLHLTCAVPAGMEIGDVFRQCFNKAVRNLEKELSDVFAMLFSAIVGSFSQCKVFFRDF